MLRRARQQQLDRIAREAFRFLIPQRWHYRKMGPDYGIGGGIQILDPSGRATGLRCRVHLSGSDAPELREALALHLPAERIEYYGSLEPAVLMARYHARTGTFYARWALRHEPQSDGPHDVEESGESETGDIFRWTASDRWDATAPVRLERDLHLLRQLSGPGLSWPLRFALRIDTPDPRETVAAQIRELWTRITPYVALVEDASDAHGSLTLSPTRICAAIGGLHAVTIHPSEPYLEGQSLRSMVVHLPVLIAVALTRAGQVEAAARLRRICAGQLRPRISS